MKLRIEKGIYGGAGLARDEGKAVFVPYTLPGELVEAHISDDRAGYANAELDNVLEASPERMAAPCPHFGECGGCHYQHARYATQVEMKVEILRESLETEGKALTLYRELLRCAEGRSVVLEEYARQMVYAEELHAGEVDKMLRTSGEVASFQPSPRS